MIVDIQSRSWNSPEQLGPALAERLRRLDGQRSVPIDASPAKLVAEMSCLSAACLLGYRCDRTGGAIPNEFIIDQVRRNPGRVVGVAGVDPIAGDPEGQVRRARDGGLLGIAVSPSTQGFHPNHTAAMRAFEVAESLGMPVWASRPGPITPTCHLEYDRPLGWDEVARNFPQLAIVIGGLGEPWIAETAMLLSKHDRIYADLAGVIGRPWPLYEALQAAIGYGVMDRLLFASGFPLQTPAKAIESLYSVNSLTHGTQLPSVPRSALRGIVERDSLAALGIEFEVLPAATPAAAPRSTERIAVRRS